MGDIPFDQPATAKRYARGGQLDMTSSGTLREAVQWVVQQENPDGDGSQKWEGPAIVALWKEASG